jgi:hypothetical protein
MSENRRSLRIRFGTSATLGVLAAFLVLALTGCTKPLPAPAYPQGYTPVTQFNTDSWNYDLHHVSNFMYGQMWYFNFVDEANDISGVVSFGANVSTNPLISSQSNYTNAMAMLIQNPAAGAPFRVWSESYPLSVPGNFYGSPTFSEGPGVHELENPSGYIDVLDPADPEGDILANTYHIVGSVSANGKMISWDLTYERQAPGWIPWMDWPFPYVLDLFGPSWMTYHMNMSSAKVNGTFVTYDGAKLVTYDIVDAKGYHDGFYGEFLFTNLAWNWADYKQRDESGNVDFSVVVHKPSGPAYSCEGGWDECLPGNLMVYNEGTVYDFYRSEINIDFITWAHDEEFNADYATEEIITAENDGNYLCLHWNELPGRLEKALWDLPTPLPDNRTFEMISQFDGAFYQKSAGGECGECANACGAECPACGSLIKNIDGVGWSDYVSLPSE